MSDNIIEFPKKKTLSVIENINKDDETSMFFAEIGFHVALDIVQALWENGYDVRNNPECIRDIFMIIETVRALGHRSENQKYAMQKISDSTFNFFDDEERILYEFIDNLEE
jgi:hypothetical protein